MRMTQLTWWIAGAVVLAGAAQAQGACSNSTLRGRYAFTLSGQIWAPPPAAGTVTGVAMTVFDGNGGGEQVDHVIHGGAAPVEAWRPATITYAINPDCTGTMTITPHPTNPADAGPVLNLDIVVTRDGSQVDTVVSGSPVNPAFAANITSIGVRKNHPEDDDE